MPPIESISSWLFWALIGVVLYVFKGTKDEIRKEREQRERLFEKAELKFDQFTETLSEVTAQVHARISKLERSVDGLWGEHRILKDTHCRSHHAEKGGLDV
jgi:hypothetical protein